MHRFNNRRTFVIADIHGAYKALLQCLRRAEFNYENDRLICLGDVCDGWPEVFECYAELQKIKNLELLLGNHDEMAFQWLMEGIENPGWIRQGGKATKESLLAVNDAELIGFITNAKTYYKENNKLFVHAGCIPGKSIRKHTIDELIWYRSLVSRAVEAENAGVQEGLTSFDEIYIGHTPTIRFGFEQPFRACEVWLMDTGAGWHGKLSMMNIHTKEIFQSDAVPGLYPNHPGRS
ncbi:MAG: serine/threonine protein phosphatase [Bacteroidetes bacterium]|jgi:serine/threonine protein phosphatase 1|nr:serine/threonine protein phosphatase [Bacteroidota bacterium]